MEVNTIKVTTDNFINVKSELLETLKENKLELLTALNEMKADNIKSHEKINERLIEK